MTDDRRSDPHNGFIGVTHRIAKPAPEYDGIFLLEENPTTIDAAVDLVNRHAGRPLGKIDRPDDVARILIFRQPLAMHVEHAVFGDLENTMRDVAVADRKTEVGFAAPEQADRLVAVGGWNLSEWDAEAPAQHREIGAPRDLVPCPHPDTDQRARQSDPSGLPQLLTPKPKTAGVGIASPHDLDHPAFRTVVESRQAVAGRAEPIRRQYDKLHVCLQIAAIRVPDSGAERGGNRIVTATRAMKMFHACSSPWSSLSPRSSDSP